MIRAVLFDAVGTVLYPAPTVVESYWHWGREFGSRLTREEVRQRFRQAWDQQPRPDFELTEAGIFLGDSGITDERNERRRWQRVVAQVFAEVPNADQELFDQLWNHFARPSHWRLFPDAIEAWCELQRRGFVVGLASNFDQRLVGVCRELPPLDECSRVFHSADVGYVKPDCRFFASVANRLELTGREIVLVGDDWWNDYEGARDAGWHSIFLNRRLETEPSQTHCIRSLSDLPAKLDSLSRSK